MVEHFPEDILECPDDLGLGEAALQFLGAAAVPWRHEVAVVGIEGVADVDQQLAGELAAGSVEQIEQAVANEDGGKNRRSAQRIRVAAGFQVRDSEIGNDRRRTVGIARAQDDAASRMGEHRGEARAHASRSKHSKIGQPVARLGQHDSPLFMGSYWRRGLGLYGYQR